MGLRLRLHRRGRHTSGPAEGLPRPVYQGRAGARLRAGSARRALRSHGHTDPPVQFYFPDLPGPRRQVCPRSPRLQNIVHPRPTLLLLHGQDVHRVYGSLDLRHAQRHHAHVGRGDSHQAGHPDLHASAAHTAGHRSRHPAARDSRGAGRRPDTGGSRGRP